MVVLHAGDAVGRPCEDVEQRRLRAMRVGARQEEQVSVQDLDDVSAAEAAVRHAITKRVLVTATYNRGRSTLAPHSIFTRHGELYLRAITVERDGRQPKEPKLGTFKLIGLSDVAATRRLFSRAMFDRLDPPPPAPQEERAMVEQGAG